MTPGKSLNVSGAQFPPSVKGVNHSTSIGLLLGYSEILCVKCLIVSISERVGHLPKVTQLVRSGFCAGIRDTTPAGDSQLGLYCQPPPSQKAFF